MNSGCHFFDQGGITIGDDCLFGPAVKLITSNHPLDPEERRAVVSKPIVIGRNVWIGAASIVLPGVTIGDNSVIGAGSIVTHDIPPNVVALGSPAKVVKQICQTIDPDE